MGLLKSVAKALRRRSVRRQAALITVKAAADGTAWQARCELLEPRMMLASDLLFGSVYFEEATGDDSAGDVLLVGFVGGTAGTQLDQVVIEGDKKGDGLSEGDAFFDTQADGIGSFNHVPLTIESHEGFAVTAVRVVDGGTRIVIDLEGFDAGEKLIFSVDVDEASFVDEAAGVFESTSVVEGGEFQRARLLGQFSAPHFADMQLEATYWDSFTEQFRAATALTGRDIGLPPDEYDVDHDLRDRTAGAIARAVQTPLPIDLSGTVFADNDLDNLQDVDELGIAQVELSLWAFDPVLGDYAATGKTTATDAAGHYQFDANDGVDIPPGRYQIRETQPAGYFSVGARAGMVDSTTRGVTVGADTITEINLLGGDQSVGNNFAEALPVSLSGYVYHDVSNDGHHDTGELGIENVTVQVVPVTTVDGDSATLTTRTDAAGYWQISGMAPGEYDIAEPDQPNGYLDGLDEAGRVAQQIVGRPHNPGDEITGVFLEGGQAGVQYNFGELLPSSISGQVHASTDGDCTAGPNDILLAGVQVHLLDGSGRQLATTLTDQSGNYVFAGLAPGEYQVFEHQPEGYFDGTDHPGTAGGRSDGVDTILGIVLTSGTTAEQYNFCEHVGVTLAGHVYHDANNNGQRETDEAGIGGVTVLLLDADGQATGVRRTTSSAAGTLGDYEFANLAAGTYGVAEQQPAGYLDGLDAPGNRGGQAANPGDRIVGAVLPFGQHGFDYDFGELLPSSISGRVHASTDGNCTAGPNDILLAGVQVDLLDPYGQRLATTLTGVNGDYVFAGLAPGEYQVFEHQPEGYFDGTDHPGTAGGRSDGVDTILGIVLASGTTAEQYNFCEHVGVTLAGHVYHDANNNGQRETDETGIGGVTVLLLDADGQDTGVRRTTSSAAGTLGDYEFANLTAGTYGVAEQQPVGYLDGLDAPGNRGGQAANPGDRIVGAVLPFGQHGLDYDFGELLPSSISGSVHARTGADCLSDPNAVPLEGVVIELLDAAGTVVARTTTDTAGDYRFESLLLGTYAIREIQPAEYFDGGAQVGSGGGEVLGTNRMESIHVGSGQHLVDYRFCEVPPATISGYVFQDGPALQSADGMPADLSQVRDGVLTSDDRRLSGVTLELGHGVTGEPIVGSQALPGSYGEGPIRVTTNSQGYYQFDGLPGGTYAVFEIQPATLTDGIDTPGSLGGIAVNAHARPAPFVILQLIIDPGNDAILRIPLPAGQISSHNNFSEVLVTPFLPVLPPPDVPLPEPAAPPSPWAPMPSARLLPQQLTPIVAPPAPFGGSSPVVGFTWHLSVIDGGRPRALPTEDQLVQMTSSRFDVVAWRRVNMQQSSWKFRRADELDEDARRLVLFGTPDAVPVTGDFNGDGITEQGVFIKGQWFIDLNGNGQWDSDDLWAKLGHEGDLPVTGDWDGDGKTDIGIFGPAWPGDPMAVHQEPGLPDPHNAVAGRPKNLPPDRHHAAVGTRTMKLTAQGKPRADLIDHVFHYGTAGDRPVAGDWNGDGIETIGVFHDGDWNIDVNGDGKWTPTDVAFHYGQAGDIAVVGDWNGDGVAQVGIYRAGVWRLDTNGNHQLDSSDQTIELGTAADRPVVGDWDGDGTDEPGVYLRRAG